MYQFELNLDWLPRIPTVAVATRAEFLQGSLGYIQHGIGASAVNTVFCMCVVSVIGLSMRYVCMLDVCCFIYWLIGAEARCLALGHGGRLGRWAQRDKLGGRMPRKYGSRLITGGPSGRGYPDSWRTAWGTFFKRKLQASDFTDGVAVLMMTCTSYGQEPYRDRLWQSACRARNTNTHCIPSARVGLDSIHLPSH
jgi:hypothetical protein